MPAEMLSPPLIIQDVYKDYGDRCVLKGINLRVDSGAIYGLVGLNGAGKSTTMQCALGLIPFDRGNIRLFGVPPDALYQLRGKVSVVFDEPGLLLHLTVLQQLQWANKITRAQASIEKLHLITQRLGLTQYHDYKTSQLSLGNRRRLSIAVALVGDPALLIMDEPFNGLDAGGVESVLEIIQSLQMQGITFLLASHQLSYLERICTHLAILHQGKILMDNRLDELLNNHLASVQIIASQNIVSVLNNLPGVKLLSAREIENKTAVVCELAEINSATLNRSLVAADVEVYELAPMRQTVTEIFKTITESHDVVIGN